MLNMFSKIIFFSTIFCASLTTLAQESYAPNIAYVYPAGAKAGDSVKITLGGRNFKGVTDIYLTGDGAKTGVFDITIPFKAGQYFNLRNKLMEKYVKAHPEVVEEMKKFEDGGQRYLHKLVRADEEITKKLAAADASVFLRKLSSDPMAETVEFELQLSPDASKGARNILVKSNKGLSNPIKFIVSDSEEFVKPSLRDTARNRIKLPKYWGREGIKSWKNPLVYPSESNKFYVELPIIVNGQITEAKTDAYYFYAEKGESIVIDVKGRTLVPYISDAVPGWFQPVVRVTDANGQEVAYCDDFYHRPDPHLSFTVLKSGIYCAEIFDAIYRSREDFVYRMSISTNPFVEYIFPLAANPESGKEFEIGGANLKSNRIKIKLPAKNEIVCPKVHGDILEDLKLKSDNTPSKLSAAESAKIVGGSVEILPSVVLTPPACADGRMTKSGQVDMYRLDASQGQKIVLETFARRLGSPMDTYITVSDSSGKILARADDFEDSSYGLVTAHTDSRLIFTAPFTGTFYVRIGDLTGAHSLCHAYRLEVRQPTPNYELRTVPSVVNFNSGRTSVFRVYAFRTDGIDDYPIRLEVSGLPKDAKVFGAEIGAGEKYADVAVTIAKKSPRKVFEMSVWGKAEFANGRSIAKKSMPCDDMMQAFYYRHYVPACGMWGSINSWNIFGRGYDLFVPDISKVQMPVKFKAGESVKIDIGSAPNNYKKLPKPEFQNSNSDLTIKGLKVENGRMMIEIVCAQNPKTQKGKFVLNLLGKHWRGMFLLDKVPSISYTIGCTGKLENRPLRVSEPDKPTF